MSFEETSVSDIFKNQNRDIAEMLDAYKKTFKECANKSEKYKYAIICVGIKEGNFINEYQISNWMAKKVKKLVNEHGRSSVVLQN